MFARVCVAAGVPEPETEFRFAHPRKWRFDFCWPDHKLALEVQGAIFTQGRHTRGAALLREHEKLNHAAILGWRVLFTTPDRLLSEGIDLVKAAIRQ